MFHISAETLYQSILQYRDMYIEQELTLVLKDREEVIGTIINEDAWDE